MKLTWKTAEEAKPGCSAMWDIQFVALPVERLALEDGKLIIYIQGCLLSEPCKCKIWDEGDRKFVSIVETFVLTIGKSIKINNSTALTIK